MKKRVTAMELRKKFGEYIDEVRLKHNTIVIKRGNREVAALVPLSYLELIERERAKDAELVKEIRERNRKFNLKEIQKDVEDAIKKIRG